LRSSYLPHHRRSPCQGRGIKSLEQAKLVADPTADGAVRRGDRFDEQRDASAEGPPLLAF
jgi:hypothetical protein